MHSVSTPLPRPETHALYSYSRFDEALYEKLKL